MVLTQEQSSAQSRERTAAAAAGDPVARSGIKSDY